MTLTGKEKAVVAFIITLVLGAISTIVAYSGFPTDLKPLLELVASLVTLVGTTFGVYQVTNSTTDGEHDATNDDAPVVDTDATPVPAPTVTEVPETPTATTTAGGE